MVSETRPTVEPLAITTVWNFVVRVEWAIANKIKERILFRTEFITTGDMLL